MDTTLKLKNGSNGIANALKQNGPITEYDFLFDSLGEAAQSKGVSLNDVKGEGVKYLNLAGKAQQQAKLIAAKTKELMAKKPDNKEKTEKIVKKAKGFFGLSGKAITKAQGAADAIAAQKAKEAERNKNEAFKFGLGLIACGALFGALMFPNMKDQFAQLISDGKPVMEKVFAALKVLANAVIVFVPIALGALLLWFAYSEKGPEKGGIIEAIIKSSMAFFIGIEDAIFGPPTEEEANKPAEEEKPKTEEAPKTEETKAMIQQRIAMLQMDLAQIAHDLA